MISFSGLFVGCGGLDYGFKEACFTPAWANEICKDASESYRRLIGHSVITGDIWDKFPSMPSTDVIIGGPPCQAFSLVGKRLLDDPRATLVFAFLEVIKQRKPKVFVMENVPGLLASKYNNEKLPVFLSKEFMKIGYNVSLHTILASDYYVPQRRKRVFMVGHLFNDKQFQLITPDDYSKIIFNEKITNPITAYQALNDLPTPLEKGSNENAEYIQPYDKCNPYQKLMRKASGKNVSLQTMPTMSLLDKEFVKFIPPGGNYSNIPDEISTKRIMNFKSTGGRTTTYGRLHPDFPSYTINTYFNRPNVGAHYHYAEERLITVREAMRLQSFPDHFQPFFSNQRNLHTQIGNAVPPLLARAVAESIKALFE